MSLSGALSNAVSGLFANAAATTVVSSNVANAMNETYARRAVSLSTNARQTSGGVVVAQVTRYSDPISAYQTRLAIAEHSAASSHAAFQTGLEQLVGSIDTIGSIAEKLTRFESELLSAASDPSSQTRLKSMSSAAEALTLALNKASQGLVDLRSEADAKIASAVADINSGLAQLEDINTHIMSAKHSGQDVHGLLDQRDATLQALSKFVPLHVVERGSGAIAVFTTQGRTLLDECAAKFGFTPTPVVLPHMSVGNGLVSQLSVNDKTVEIPGTGMLKGGSLEALFEIRDLIAPNAHDHLDAIARDMIERFGAGGPDQTLGTGDLGVFTDDGAQLDPAAITGLAGRIRLNHLLSSPSPEIWRWRDGLNALQQGDAGQSDLLLNLHSEISLARIPSAPALGTNPRSLVGHLHSLSNDVASDRLRLVDAEESAATRLDDLRQASARNGVNTDQELQKLIELEKSYAANARVVQVVDDMLSELLSI